MKNKNSVEEALIQSLKEARDYEKGHKTLSSRSRELPAPAPVFRKSEILAIRKKILQMTQEEFALALNVKVATIRSWEQGSRRPEKGINRLLQIIKVNPLILNTLKAA